MSRGIAASRALTCAMLLFLTAVLAGSVAGSAFAQPGDTDAQTNVATEGDQAAITLGWPSLGLDSGTDLFPDSSRSFRVPVPAGLVASRLQGVLHTPMNIAAGYLEVNDGDGNFLAGVDLPPPASGLVLTPFDVDISAAPIRGSSVEISFIVRALDGADRVCGPVQRLELRNLATVFTGSQLPATTVADFFPSVLETVTIYAATDASAAEQQAVLSLVSTLARLYYPRPPAIEVVSQLRGKVPPPPLGMMRAIVVGTGPPGLTVENPGTPEAYLRVSGEGEELSTQVSLLATGLQPLTQSASARVDEAGADATLDGDTLTFSQLNVSGDTSFVRTSSLRLGIDRTSLGPRFDGVTVHLLADYTPVSEADAATVVIRSRDLVVYRASLDETGVLDATLTLDSQMLDKQWIDLEFALTYTPDQECGPLIAPINFQIDPRSTLTMNRGGPPLGGFTAFPYEFSPRFVVALDGSGPNQLNYAARVVAAIAGLTRNELAPEVVDLQAAAAATSGALIVANSQAVRQTPLNPPVSGDGSMVNFGLPSESRINIDDGLGSIQAFADPPRDRSVVLVTTTADWNLVDPLFSYIDGTEGDWSQLSGDVLAAGAGGVPTTVAIRPAADIFEQTQSSASGSWVGTGLAVGGGIAAIAVLAAMLYLRRRSTVPAAGETRRSAGSHSADN